MDTQAQTEPQANRKMDAREFARYELRMNPDLTYDELKAKAALEGVVVHPIVFGRIRRELGLAPALPPRRERPERAERPDRSMPPETPPHPLGASGTAGSAGQEAPIGERRPVEHAAVPWAGTAPRAPLGIPARHVAPAAPSDARPRTAASSYATPGFAAASGGTMLSSVAPLSSAGPLSNAGPAKAPVIGDDLQALVRLVREAAAEQQRMRAALERIRGILDAALEG